ncbi:MAG: HEAT repeat domain-containing protein [Planctomycetota bacterium]|nr:HEAT repeat domain-containing protein [Planctomycetota bacterium]
MYRAFLLFTSMILPAAGLQGGDLRPLTEEYRRASRKVSGTPEARKTRVERHVQPVLDEIGELDTDESLRFLLAQLRKATPPEIAAACVRPLLKSSSSKVVRLILADFARRPRAVQQAILAALGGSKRELRDAEAEILAVATAPLAPEVRAELPAVLGKVGTVAAVKTLFSTLRDERRQGALETPYGRAVIDALKESSGEDVRKWLSGDVFSSRRATAARLEVAATLAGELRLTGARTHLVKLLTHRSVDVAEAAVGALSRIGVGDDARSIARALKRRPGAADLSFRIAAMDALASSDSERAADVVLDFARGTGAVMRKVALGSLASRQDDPRALKALFAALRDKDQGVRFVALRSLTRVKRKAVVAPLIEALGGDGAYAFRVKVLELLIRLTGKNMGLVEEDWNKWWELASASFQLPEAGEKGFTSVRAYDLEYFGIELSSKRLSFLVDISSSMTREVPVRKRRKRQKAGGGSGGTTVGGGETKDDGDGGDDDGDKEMARKIEILKRELVRVLKKLTPDTFVNILVFDKKYRSWQKALQPLKGRGRDRAVRYVESLNTGRGTNVFDTLEFALKDKRVNTIYLLTDGQPTRGRLTDPEAILKEVEKLNRLRAVTIHCIAFGEESQLLVELAKAHGGRYRYVEEY